MKDSTSKAIQAGSDIVSTGALAVAGGLLATGHPALAAAAAMTQPALVRIVAALTSKTMSDELRDQIKAAFIDELLRHLQSVDQRLTAMEAEGKRLDWGSVSLEEVRILIEQYHEHAQHSSRQGRRKMLAAAAAGSARPDVEGEMKSRAERALAVLEPSDIAVLRDFVGKVSSEEEAAKHFGGWSGIRAYWGEQPVQSRISLERTGCILIETEFHKGNGGRSETLHSPPRMDVFIHPTPLAEAILTILETYQAAESEQTQPAA